MHWRTKHKKRLDYFTACDFCEMMRHEVHPAPRSPVELRATLYMGNHMDDDNALARLKWPVDWLKTRGYLVDDARKHCRMTIPEQVVKRNQEYRVEITLTPIVT
jgi:hypothetical protein